MSKAADSLTRRFGQNLSESLGVRTSPTSAAPVGSFHREIGPDDGRSRARDAGHMEVERIIPDPDQPRKDFSPEAIERLAASLLKHGQLQPIRVRWNAERGMWVVIAGERRYRAALLAGLKTVACIFVDGALTPSEILQEQMVENCLREDLKPTEQARAYRQLMEANGWTAKELAEELHISQATISRALTLLTLPADLQGQVDSGAVPASAAYEVAKVQDDGARRDIIGAIVAGDLTRDEAAKVAREVSGRTSKSVKSRGGAKARRETSRVVRTSAAKVTVELRKGSGAEAILAALREAVGQVEQELHGREEAAA